MRLTRGATSTRPADNSAARDERRADRGRDLGGRGDRGRATIGASVTVARRRAGAMERSAAVVAALVDGEQPAYGVSTGFGSLALVPIPAARREELQRALVRSHAAGMGPPVEREVVRAMMLLRARTLAMGCSGARPVVAETMLALLNAGLTPVVPEHGSLGASGDLAPLAHCALALIGEGEVGRPDGARPTAAAGARAAGIEPLALTAKEGLALINGTDGMLGMLVLAIADLGRCCASPTSPRRCRSRRCSAPIARSPPICVALRPQPGQAAERRQPARAAGGLGDRRQPSRGRPPGPGRVLDALLTAGRRRRPGRARLRAPASPPPSSSRRSTTRWCCPTAGSSRAATSTARRSHSRAISSRSPRPRSARSPSGAPTGCSTRRARTGLPPFLAPDPGVNSGLMLAQYAQAAMVAENRRLAAPASVDSLPTSAMQEDHVSMGWGAARKLRLAAGQPDPDPRRRAGCAARALDLRAPLAPAPGTAAALGPSASGCRARVQTATWRPSCRDRAPGRQWRISRRGGGEDRGAAMSLLTIATVGDPVLRERAPEIDIEELRSPQAQRLIDDLIETKRAAGGAGLPPRRFRRSDGSRSPRSTGTRDIRTSRRSR